MGLKAINTHRMVEGMKTLGHGVAMRRHNQVTVFITFTQWVQAQILGIHVGFFFVAFRLAGFFFAGFLVAAFVFAGCASGSGVVAPEG